MCKKSVLSNIYAKKKQKEITAYGNANIKSIINFHFKTDYTYRYNLSWNNICYVKATLMLKKYQWLRGYNLWLREYYINYKFLFQNKL